MIENEVYEAQKKCYLNRKAEAKERMPHYSDKGGHKERSDYWKQVKKDEHKETKERSR